MVNAVATAIAWSAPPVMAISGLTMFLGYIALRMVDEGLGWPALVCVCTAVAVMGAGVLELPASPAPLRVWLAAGGLALCVLASWLVVHRVVASARRRCPRRQP